MRYKIDEIPPTMVAGGEAAEMLGLAAANGIGVHVAGLRVAGTIVRPSGKAAKLYWREDIERVAEARRAADADYVSARQAMLILRVTTPQLAYCLLKKAGLRADSKQRNVGGNRTTVFPRAAVERLAAERLAGKAAEAEAAEAAEAVAVQADLAAVKYPSSNDYADPVEVPQVMYGLLDYHDALALLARKAKNPDWRPCRVA